MRRADLNYLIMSFAALAAGIAATGSMINNWINNKQSLKQQKKLYDYTLAKDIQANRQMVTESPMLQAIGMKRAGLNPAGINGGFQGSASSGDSNANYSPLNLDVANALMMGQQIQNETATTKANVAKTNAETNYLNKQAGRFDELTDADIAVKRAEAKYKNNVDQREQELQTYAVKQAMQAIDLNSKDLDFKQMQNDALNREYDFNGQKVKGSDIPYFKELFSLSLAQETMKFNWASLKQKYDEMNADWKRLLTKNFLEPLVTYIREHYFDAPEIIEGVKEKVEEATEFRVPMALGAAGVGRPDLILPFLFKGVNKDSVK